MSIRISDYFGKNLGEKTVLALIISIVSLITIYLSSWQAPISQAQTAAPLISSIAGVVSDGSVVTISGSGFGSKSVAAPYMWDSVDNQSYSGVSEGALVPAGSGYVWQYNDTTYSDGIKLTRNRTSRGLRASHYYLDVKGWLTGWDNMDGGNAAKLYATWWMKPSANIVCGPSGQCASTKVIRVWSSSNAQRAALSWTGNQITYEYGDGRGQISHWKNWQGLSNEWNRLEVYVDNPSGLIELYTNGALVDRLEVGQPAYYLDRIWRIGLDPSMPENLDQSLKVDFGEIYLDNTPARVEVCTGSVWSNKGQCEIQIPTAWSNNSIQVKINQGNLTNSQQAYVYILNNNNITSQNGYPVTIVGTVNPPSVPPVDIQAPSVPSSFSATASGTQIVLSWAAATDNVSVSRYLLERSNTSASSGFSQMAIITANSYSDTSLNSGATYYYRVRAQDAAGNISDYSSIVSATTPTATVNPPVLGNFNGQSWERVYYKDFENNQILETGKFTVHLGLPIATGYQIVNDGSNKVLQGNLGSSGDKRSQVLMLNLENMGIAPQGEFYLKTKVKIRPNNLWCVASDYGATPTTICPNGRDGTKLAYAFGDNGVAWIPGMGFPPAESGFGQWKFTDNRGNGTGSGYQRYFDNASNVTVDDGQWHEWIWHFRHNTQTNGVWNNDGVYEFYIDNILAARATDVPYTIIRDGITRDGSFNRISKPISYFGGGGTLANDWIYWVDNIEIYKPSSNNNNPTASFSPWCSALQGIVSATIEAGINNQVADLNHDGRVTLTDLTLMASWYSQGSESSCQGQFNNTYNSSNYLSIDWCSGVLKGLQDSLGTSQGNTNYSSMFDLNNDGSINLTDTVLISQYKSANNQNVCFTEYNLPLSTVNNQTLVKNVVLLSKVVQDSQKVRQKDVQSIALKVKNQTAQQVVRTLKNRLAYDSIAGSLFYTNTKGKVIVFDNSSLVKQLAKQALGISTNNLARIATGLTPGGDTDGDGLADTVEAAIGTDINKIDTDSDGIADGIEVANKYSPLKSSRTKLSDSLAKRLGVGRILIDSKKGNIWIIGADYKKYLVETGTTVDTLKELYLVVVVDGVGVK